MIGFQTLLRRLAGCFAALACFGLVLSSQASAGPAAVDADRLNHADAPGNAGNWMSHGRTWSEQRFSPLKQINDGNAARLGLAWYADLGTYRGVEATPLEIDGVLYNVSAWSIVTAYDATNGKVLWTYDPKVPPEYARITCCGPVSRGLAAWKGKIYVAALDGRLIALDAADGRKLWETDTKDPGQPLSLTGAPRVADGNVVIGNSGGDVGSRGYMSAYNAETGKQVWKFYIVPGDPAKMPEGFASDSAMPMAAKTWTGEWWKQGGGGNNWDGIVFDPAEHLVYFGTGNGSPHPAIFRSPQGGDNLFLCSIVAVDSRTGKYRWHYQEIPAEEWDYDCTSPLILADLKIDGKPRKVIMHAPKDGFFYVLDRTSGKLLSANNYMPNTWASHIDMKTGRPVVNPEAMVEVKPALITPGYGGGHNWNPMSYSPLTGLVYIPVLEGYAVISRVDDDDFKFVLGKTTLAAGVGNYPELRKQFNQEAADREKGYMLAWNPVTQKEAWRIPYPHAGNGGTMTTAGNLLVEGTINKTLAVYRADNGQKLWEMPVGSVPVSGPITYMVKGRQYIAVNAGWNSAIVSKLTNPDGSPFSFAPARLLVFALDAKGVTLPPAPPSDAIPPPPNTPISAELRKQGEVLYARNCQACHAPNAVGGVKDLRHMSPATHAEFLDIVLGGKRAALGMPNFGTSLTHDEAEAIHAYLIARAQDDWQPQFVARKQQ
ncbi:MAG: PQQ-dependent dehydrogenase, methanol/ethanol family [Novosphingobium sp.]|nr:PQQ-dependent dehydrogenase, methanol/ethanol family [Novosphingobium sp.]